MRAGAPTSTLISPPRPEDRLLFRDPLPFGLSLIDGAVFAGMVGNGSDDGILKVNRASIQKMRQKYLQIRDSNPKSAVDRKKV
jgi:hypothetical protein